MGTVMVLPVQSISPKDVCTVISQLWLLCPWDHLCEVLEAERRSFLEKHWEGSRDEQIPATTWLLPSKFSGTAVPEQDHGFREPQRYKSKCLLSYTIWSFT